MTTREHPSYHYNLADACQQFHPSQVPSTPTQPPPSALTYPVATSGVQCASQPYVQPHSWPHRSPSPMLLKEVALLDRMARRYTIQMDASSFYNPFTFHQPSIPDDASHGGWTQPSHYATSTGEDSHNYHSPSDQINSLMEPARKVISTAAVLRASEKRRSRPHKFFCPYCTRGFTAKHNYDRHIAAHNDTRPHLCPCGSTFTTKADLKRHQDRANGHTGCCNYPIQFAV